MLIYTITLLGMISQLILLVYFMGEANGFILKIDEDKKFKSFWDYKDFERKNHSPPCNCGEFKPDKWSPPWNLYVHTSRKTCTGTVVNSNLIVTSHKCLLFDGGSSTNKEPRMRLVDVLKFKFGRFSIARAENITVTNTKDKNAGDAKKYNVLDVWYNPGFAISSENKSYPKNDLVLVKVSEDLISTQNYTPICVPYYSKEMKEMEDLFQPGFYYDNSDVESNASVIPARLEGTIMKKSICSSALAEKFDDDSDVLKKTLCLKYSDDGKTRSEGGPLVVAVTSNSDKKVAFLLGVATGYDDLSTLVREASTGTKYAYFSFILEVVKFIEYHAQLDTDTNKSTWCNTPKLRLQTDERRVRSQSRAQKPWAWDLVNPSALNRDESLDCVCGEPNTKIWGRVVGGVQATPREFGWMTLISLYVSGRGGGSSLCGGAIINDRVVLTAAHCVVVDSWVHNGGKDVTVDPKNIDVTFNAHLRKGDPEAIKKSVASVLFHPQYLDARLAKPDYYDTDLALLVLKDPLEFPANGPGIRPICLHKVGTNIELEGKSAWVVGWGLTNPEDTHSTAETLQKIKVPIEDLKTCSDIARTRVTENFICAGTLNMYKDAARGDSGGPLQMEDRASSQWYEVGAVSWGEDVYKNGRVLTAALYANLQKLMPFVDYHSKRHGAKWCKAKRNDTSNP